MLLTYKINLQVALAEADLCLDHIRLVVRRQVGVVNVLAVRSNVTIG